MRPTRAAAVALLSFTLPWGAALALPPDGTIDTPAGGLSILVGASVNFTGTGTDPDSDFPLTYLWDFDQSKRENLDRLREQISILLRWRPC